LFISDCCRNDIFGGKGFDVCPESRDIAFTKITSKASVDTIPPLILSSCHSKQRSYENDSVGHGYFTNILERVLRCQDINNFKSFRESLHQEMLHISGIPTKQTPCWNGDVDGWNNVKLLTHWSSRRNVNRSQQQESPRRNIPHPQQQKLDEELIQKQAIPDNSNHNIIGWVVGIVALIFIFSLFKGCSDSNDCSRCDGAKVVKCSECKGTGEVDGILWGKNKCSDCDGKGKTVCGKCDGSGKE
jgi:hypothetical protein